MTYANFTVLLMVVSVVTVVMGISFAAIYCLNKAVDQSDG